MFLEVFRFKMPWYVPQMLAINKPTCEFENNHFFYICFAKPHEKSHEKTFVRVVPPLDFTFGKGFGLE